MTHDFPQSLILNEKQQQDSVNNVFLTDTRGRYTLVSYHLAPGGVRHGPQRVMGKNITDVHFTLGTME